MTKKEREFVLRKGRTAVKEQVKDKDDPYFHESFHERIEKLGAKT